MNIIQINPMGQALQKLEKMPLGINLNFLMDGQYYENPKRPLSEALKEMGVGYLRYPGGEKSDNMLWSLPPFEKPEPTLARYGEFEMRECFAEFIDKDYRHFKPFILGFDEFIELCREINAEPVVVVPYDTMFIPPMPGCTIPTKEQLLQNAVEWVRYANIRMGYGVKYWEIGNESYIIAHRSGASARDYARDLIEFSNAMKAIDPSIIIAANGPNCVHDNEKAVSVMDCGEGLDWWSEVLRYGSQHIDRIAFHNYPCLGWGGYEYYATKDTNLIEAPHKVKEILEHHVGSAEAKRIKLMLTETNSADWSAWIPGGDKSVWSYSANLGHALVLADIIGSHLMLDYVENILVWNTRWVLNNKKPIYEFWDSLDENNDLLPAGVVISMWGQNLLDEMLPIEAPKGFSVYLCATSNREHINLFLINKTEKLQNISINMSGDGEKYNIQSAKIFTGNDSNDTSPHCTDMILADYVPGNTVVVPAVSFSVISFVKNN